MRGFQRAIGFYALLQPVGLLAVSLIISVFTPDWPPGVNMDDPGASVLFWAQNPSGIGLDHGLKGIAVLFFGLIPYWIWYRSDSKGKPTAQLGLAAGVLCGLTMGFSLSLQAATMVFAARGVAAHPELTDVYKLIGDWGMSGGVLSHALYTIAQLFLAVWLVAHASLLKERGQRWMGLAAQIVAVPVVAASVFVWIEFMTWGVSDAAHMTLQTADFLAQIWVAVLGFTWVRESFRGQPVTASMGS